MRRTVMISGVFAVVVVAAAAGFLLGRGDDSARLAAPDPDVAASVSLPPLPPDAPPADTVLTGDAALVARFRALTAPLLDLAGVDGAARRRVCEAVASDLNAEVDPGALLAAAGAVTDPLLSELALDARAAVSATLVACGADDKAATDEGLLAVAAIDVVFTRRLEQLA